MLPETPRLPSSAEAPAPAPRAGPPLACCALALAADALITACQQPAHQP